MEEEEEPEHWKDVSVNFSTERPRAGFIRPISGLSVDLVEKIISLVDRTSSMASMMSVVGIRALGDRVGVVLFLVVRCLLALLTPCIVAHCRDACVSWLKKAIWKWTESRQIARLCKG